MSVQQLAGALARLWLDGHSLLLVAFGGLMLKASSVERAATRRALALVLLSTVTVAFFTYPLPATIRMGDSNTYLGSVSQFERYCGVSAIRLEAHLSYAVLGRLYLALGPSLEAARRAFGLLMRGATIWFVASAVLVSWAEAWSPAVIRYVGLVLLSPVALMFFGYRELGYLSLNLAVFPLVARGLAERSWRLPTGAALAGLGAAFHGFGLLSVAGLQVASAGSTSACQRRVGDCVRVGAAAALMYLPWFALYVWGLHLPLERGHTTSIPLRPLLVSAVGDRINVALLSWQGLRDVAASGWVTGGALLCLVGWRTDCGPAALRRLVLLYAIPSSVFLVAFWPVQGLAMEMDVVFAAFPAMFGLAWWAAQDPSRTYAAAALLASGHWVFWRVVLDRAFINARV